jgi:hypothetical protein
MSDGPISLGDNNDYGSISRRSFPCISTKSLPLDESGYPSDRSTPCSIDSPHTPSHAPSNQNTPNDPVLRVRSESFPMSDSLIDGVSGRLFADPKLRHEQAAGEPGGPGTSSHGQRQSPAVDEEGVVEGWMKESSARHSVDRGRPKVA